MCIIPKRVMHPSLTASTELWKIGNRTHLSLLRKEIELAFIFFPVRRKTAVIKEHLIAAVPDLSIGIFFTKFESCKLYLRLDDFRRNYSRELHSRNFNTAETTAKSARV